MKVALQVYVMCHRVLDYARAMKFENFPFVANATGLESRCVSSDRVRLLLRFSTDLLNKAGELALNSAEISAQPQRGTPSLAL